jgi:hypothetical protein
MLRIAPLLAGLLLVTACGKEKKKDDPAPAEATTPEPDQTDTGLRKVAKDSYTSVGLVTVGGNLRCSGLILKHGVFATAKHCFWSDNPDKSTLGLIFTAASGIIGDDSIKVPASDIKELNLDGDGNDIAYVIYDASKTKGKVVLTTTNIMREPPAPDTPMSLVGFPSPVDRVYRKLVTAPCKRLDKEGTIEPNATDEKGYDGELYDTDCGAWFGNSGGPLFVMDAADPTKVVGTVGVVTHTFDIDETGAIPDAALITDTFGTYVKTVNFSCYKDAKTLDENLAKGED